MAVRVLEGDARDMLKTLPPESVHCVVTSPPYYGLRDYGISGQIGLEPSPSEYISALASVFYEVRRVLRKDGTCWLNVGDSYVAKDLLGIPWLLVFALKRDGWCLRSDIIWSKPDPMPESVQDRPTRAHEYVFLLTKSARYFYDGEAIREERSSTPGAQAWARIRDPEKNFRKVGEAARAVGMGGHVGGGIDRGIDSGRNKRSVWEIASEPYSEAHVAVYPTALVEPCIKAGSPRGGTVLDPFCGAGTTLLVADRLDREAIGIELNPTYAAMARRRVTSDAPMFAQVW